MITVLEIGGQAQLLGCKDNQGNHLRGIARGRGGTRTGEVKRDVVACDAKRGREVPCVAEGAPTSVGSLAANE